MAVFRVEKTKDFTIMCNHHLRNTELSLKAKGLLSLMLSLPEDWDYTTKGLAHICKDGVDSITTALKELERHGYLTRQRLRYGNGQLGDIEYTIHEKPVNAEKQEYSPKRENPRQVNPGQAEPGQENPAQLNTNPLRTKKSKTDISRTHQSIYPAEPEAAGRSDGMDRIELADAYYTAIADLRSEYKPGQEISARLKSADQQAGTIEISVKEVNPNPYFGAEKRHPVGSTRKAVISGTYAGGVFCRLSDDTTCMCLYSPNYFKEEFYIGDSVLISISRFDDGKRQVYGRILSKL